MMFKTKFLSFSTVPNEYVAEWVIAVIVVLFAIIVFFVIGPPPPPDHISPSERHQTEVINEY